MRIDARIVLVALAWLALPMDASAWPGAALPEKDPEETLTAPDPDGLTALNAQVDQVMVGAMDHIYKGEFAAAREMWADSIELFTRRYGAGQWQVVEAAAHEKSCAKAARLSAAERERLRWAFLTVGVALKAARSDSRKALRYFKAVWETQKELLGEDDFYSSRPAEDYALYLVLENPEQSRAILQRVVKIRKQVIGVEHPLYASALQHLGAANGVLQNFDEAVTQFHEAEQIYLHAYGRHSLKFATCQFYKLVMLVDCRKFEEAEALAEPVLKLSTKSQATEPWLNIRVRLQQARALHGSRKLEAALSTFEEITKFLESASEEHGLVIQIQSYEFYVAALDDAGREADAARIRQRIAQLQRELAKQRGEDEPGDDVLELPPEEGQ